MKKARRSLLRLRWILLPVMVVVAMSGVASAAAVRGRLERPLGRPAADVTVTVSNPNGSKRSASYRTDSEGMFYLSIPSGKYHLEIWLVTPHGARPLVYEIDVVEPVTDLRPIVLPAN